jgi:hypothetical protein
MSHQPNRRFFLKSTVGVIASFSLPEFLTVRETPRSFWFLQANTGNSWPVADPVLWSLSNARQPVLERASMRLLKLTPTDDTRIIRLVVRRCKLNLLELHSDQVVVHHWVPQGLADLRPFFKTHGLARKAVEVVVKERKRERVVLKAGDDFLYGDRLGTAFPLQLFMGKWKRRHMEEANDWTAVPETQPGYGWKGVEPNSIPWAALKSTWRRTAPFICLNCDKPTVMVHFGYPQCSMFNRTSKFLHVCQGCRRVFEDRSIRDVPRWMVANLDADVLPDYDIFWGQASKWKPPATMSP